MKATENYSFPYPECDPPLVKDSSQITQLRNLAVAIDAEVERVDNLADNVLNHPPAARVVTAAASIATTDNLVVPVFDQTVFVNNWNGFVSPIVAGGIIIPETAWWMIGAHASADSASAIRAHVRITVDGVAASSWGNPGSPYSGIFQLAALGMTPLKINENSILRMEIKHDLGGSPAWNYRPHLWAVKLVTAE